MAFGILRWPSFGQWGSWKNRDTPGMCRYHPFGLLIKGKVAFLGGIILWEYLDQGSDIPAVLRNLKSRDWDDRKDIEELERVQGWEWNSGKGLEHQEQLILEKRRIFRDKQAELKSCPLLVSNPAARPGIPIPFFVENS